MPLRRPFARNAIAAPGHRAHFMLPKSAALKWLALTGVPKKCDGTSSMNPL